MPDDELPLAFDIDEDNLVPYISGGNYTYDSATKTITLTGSDRFQLNFEALRQNSPSGNLLIYVETQGMSAATHGNFYTRSSSNEEGTELYLTKWVASLQNNNPIYTYPSGNGVAFKFLKLRVAYYCTSKLVK